MTQPAPTTALALTWAAGCTMVAPAQPWGSSCSHWARRRPPPPIATAAPGRGRASGASTGRPWIVVPTRDGSISSTSAATSSPASRAYSTISSENAPLPATWTTSVADDEEDAGRQQRDAGQLA